MGSGLKSLTAAMLLAAGVQGHAGMVDAKLLDMLLANGSITPDQHSELMSDLAAEAQAQAQAQAEAQATAAARIQEQHVEVANAAQSRSTFEQAAAWAASTSLKGDVRVRNEHINVEGNNLRDKDRQRIRARLGAFTTVNSQVSTGIQIASGNSADQRSTNQDLNNYFEKKSIWLDLAYIDYHLEAISGLSLVAGKMKQPWVAVGDVIWDGDVNPEGFAASYSSTVGDIDLFGSAGYFVLKDSVMGDGTHFENDLSLYALQGGLTFAAGERAKITLGASLDDYSGDGQRLAAGFPTNVYLVNGNTTDKFQLYEGFGKLELGGMPVPLSFYGQYVVNADARDYSVYEEGDEDTAWLVGLQTRIAGVRVDYNYRDVERNAVLGYFTDSDFAAGYVGSHGHKLKADYDLLKNLNFAITWFRAESDVANPSRDDAEVETLMIDLAAKF